MLSLDLSHCLRTIKQYVMIWSPKHQILQVIYWMKKHQRTGIGSVSVSRLQRPSPKMLLNVSNVLRLVELLTLPGFFQCAFVTTAALTWFSWYPAIVNIPQSSVRQLQEMFRLDLL